MTRTLRFSFISVWRGVSKGVEDGRRAPALWAGHSGVALPQGMEGSGMAGPGETLGSASPYAHDDINRRNDKNNTKCKMN
jgi:hypothetical protein